MTDWAIEEIARGIPSLGFVAGLPERVVTVPLTSRLWADKPQVANRARNRWANERSPQAIGSALIFRAPSVHALSKALPWPNVLVMRPLEEAGEFPTSRLPGVAGSAERVITSSKQNHRGGTFVAYRCAFQMGGSSQDEANGIRQAAI